MRRPRFIGQDGGQSVVIVALMFTVLMAGGAMGIDIGRFYAERRFVQSAVDAASLACAINYARTSDAAQAWTAGDNVLRQRNLNKNPLGIAVTYAARNSETYDANVVSDQNLNSGILPVTTSGRGCRVAITVSVPTFLIKIISPALNTISVTTRAYAKAKGGFLPSVVKRYLNSGDTDDNPTDDGSNEFVDTTAAEGSDSACHAGSNYAPSCTPASVAVPGREIVLFGASQKASNDNSFRGYLALDVRNFSDANPPNSANLLHDSYNGVAPNASVNTLKSFEAQWIGAGYPGPDVCVVTATQFDKCAQVAVVNGASSGIFVSEYNQWFRVGDIAMFQLYDGTVKDVPDFTLTPPALTVPANGAIAAKTIAFTMSSQFASSGSAVCMEIVPDDGSYTSGPGDATGKNPFTSGTVTVNSVGSCAGVGVGNFSLNSTPSGLTSYNQIWSGMTATAAQQGIYQVFLRGTASAPYASRVHVYPVKVTVGGQVTEYDISSSQSLQSIAVAGAPATESWNIVVGTGSGASKWQTTGGSPDGPVTLSWESCPANDTPTPTILACYIGAVGTTSATVTAGTTVPVTVATSGISTQNTYTGWIRTVANDRSGHPVVKLWQVRLDVDQAGGGTTKYVDVIGFAAYEITAYDSNDVYGRAVTGTYLDPSDPALAIGKKIGLVPWETP